MQYSIRKARFRLAPRSARRSSFSAFSRVSSFDNRQEDQDMSRMGRFTKGGIFGVALGSAIGLLAAPGTAEETRSNVADRIQKVRRAGVDAQAAKTQEIIQRYRMKTHDGTALKATEDQTTSERVVKLAHIDATRPSL
jgi:gas vesicle protein